MAIDFGKQVGPLPLGAWVVVVGGGLGIAYWSYRQNSGGPTEVEDTSGTPGVGDGTVGGFIPTQPAPSDDGLPETVVDTNEAWAVRAINWLIGKGYPPNVSDSAVRKYIAGEPFSSFSVQEYTLIGIVLGKWGSPPQPLPPQEGRPPTVPGSPPQPKPKPVPRPTPKPAPKPSFRYVTVTPWPTRHSTLSGIARTYHTSWQAIYNANRYGKRRADGKMGMIKSPNLIYAGWKLLLP